MRLMWDNTRQGGSVLSNLNQTKQNLDQDPDSIFEFKTLLIFKSKMLSLQSFESKWQLLTKTAKNVSQQRDNIKLGFTQVVLIYIHFVKIQPPSSINSSFKTVQTIWQRVRATLRILPDLYSLSIMDKSSKFIDTMLLRNELSLITARHWEKYLSTNKFPLYLAISCVKGLCS